MCEGTCGGQMHVCYLNCGKILQSCSMTLNPDTTQFLTYY